MSQNTQYDPILVLGSSGRLGQLLRAAWRRTPPSGPNLSYQARSGNTDILWSPGTSFSVFPRCSVVVALWGQTSGDSTALASNSKLAEISREIARHCQADRVFHFSSAAVYGPVSEAHEDQPATPANEYGQAKLAMEHVVAEFDDPAITHCCLRLANVVGADSLAPALRSAAAIRLDRFEDGGGPLRSYIGAGDLARVIEALAERPADALPNVLNVATPRPVGMEDLAKAASRDIHWQPAPTTAIQRVTLDTTRLTHLLPELDLLTTAPELIADWRGLEALA